MINRRIFGNLPSGEQVDCYTLENTDGMQIDIITLGAIITRWMAPDRTGRFDDIVLGFDGLQPYLNDHPYFGAVIGRYCNRIENGVFTLDGVAHKLNINDPPNHLHGGPGGFHTRLWSVLESDSEDETEVLKMGYKSEHMEEGFPGQLDVVVKYSLSGENVLSVEYTAVTTKPTVLNLTQHSYFNLSGTNSSILDHELEIAAKQYLPVNSDLIPTGEIAPVANTPFDFRGMKMIGGEIESNHSQLRITGGFDHCWVLGENGVMKQAATALHRESGRKLTVRTTEPGIQFYSGNFLDGTQPAKGGGTYARRSGFCLETQHYPDSPNKSHFPTTVLRRGEVFRSETTFELTVH